MSPRVCVSVGVPSSPFSSVTLTCSYPLIVFLPVCSHTGLLGIQSWGPEMGLFQGRGTPHFSQVFPLVSLLLLCSPPNLKFKDLWGTPFLSLFLNCRYRNSILGKMISMCSWDPERGMSGGQEKWILISLILLLIWGQTWQCSEISPGGAQWTYKVSGIKLGSCHVQDKRPACHPTVPVGFSLGAFQGLQLSPLLLSVSNTSSSSYLEYSAFLPL